MARRRAAKAAKVDQWRPDGKDSARNPQRPDTAAAISKARRPSPVPARFGKQSGRAESQNTSRQDSSSYHHPSARSSSRDRAGSSRHTTRRSRSPVFAPRDDDRYRPARPHVASPRISHYSPPRRSNRSYSRSPARDNYPPRRLHENHDLVRRRGRTPPHRAISPRRRLDRAYPLAPSHDERNSRRNSPRRRSPDYYVPASRQRSPLPAASSYRPSDHTISRSANPPVSARPTGKARSPPRPHAKPRIERSGAPQQRRLEPQTAVPHRVRQEQDIDNNRLKRPRRSTSPATSSRPRSPQQVGPGSNLSNRGRAERESTREEEEEAKRGRTKQRKEDMSHYGRGGSRGGRHYEHYGHSPSGPPFYPHDQGPPHGQSPYGGGRGGWNGYGGHGGSPPTYPPGPGPYRQNSYPGGPSPYYPPPPPQYANSPPYPPSYPPSYPPTGYRSSSGGHQSPPNSGSSRGNSRRRGHYTNLSWTPATGSRGGVQVPAKDKKGQGTPAPDEDDNPFRPSKDLRAEDEAKRESGERDGGRSAKSPNADAQQDNNKVQFGFKKFGKKTKNDMLPTDMASLAKGRKQDRRNEKKPVRRLRPRPTLPPELAASESVYYRRPGNESVVGSGTYGKVFRAIHVYTGEKVALKKIRMEGERDGFPVTAIREIKLLQSLKNDNIVRLQEVMVEKNDCYMVFEYLSHDLTGLLNHPTFKLEHAHKKHLAKQLFEGLDYLHKRGVLHRDIKAANILISSTGALKIADFGLARFFAKRRQLDYTNRVITIWYRSPELLLGETQYGPAVDIWSAACVMVEIFTRHAIFPGNGGEIDQLDKIYDVLGTPTKAEWPGITDMAWFELLRPATRKESSFARKFQDRVTPRAFELLAAMFSYDPSQRPSAAEVLAHPYFVEEEPMALQVTELENLKGDWHEFESKAFRKEREKADREARKAKEAAEEKERDGKRKADDAEGVRDGQRQIGEQIADEERRAKKIKLDEDTRKEDVAVEPREEAVMKGMEQEEVAKDPPVSA